jgi:hypothetical protein
MASLTTNPSPHIVNIFPFPNIITSASGNSAATDSVYIAELRNYVNTSNRSIKVNTLSAYSGSNVTVNNNLLLSNAALQINNTSRFNATGLGIGTTNPTATLDVVGTALVRGPLTVNGILNASTLGVGTTNPTAPLDVAGSAVIQASLTVGDLLTANALGIGTAIPLAQLDVNGASLLRSQLNVSSSIYASGKYVRTRIYYPERRSTQARRGALPSWRPDRSRAIYVGRHGTAGHRRPCPGRVEGRTRLRTQYVGGYPGGRLR